MTTDFLPLAQTVGVVKRRTGDRDAHGNPVVAWADPVDVAVYGYGPRSADGGGEPAKPGRDEVIIGLTVYAPAGVDVGPLDRVLVGGVLYEVDGEVGDWGHGPFGWNPGVSISLKRVEG